MRYTQLPSSVTPGSFELAFAQLPSGARVQLPITHYLSFNLRTGNCSIVDCDSGETDFVLPAALVSKIFVKIDFSDILVPSDFVEALRPHALQNFV